MSFNQIKYLAGTALALFLNNIASAQQAPQVPLPQPVATPDIVVTGSRLAHKANETTSPVATITSDEIKLKGTSDVDQILNELPQVSPSDGATNNDGQGVATVSLRGLGPSRTLVLVNGRRYVNFGADQEVDLNTIPTALIKRVDVVTGGRSAVYGSDAIAGVVNFVLKDDFTGLQLDGMSGITSEGDGAKYAISAIAGANTSDGRGNITLYGGYQQRDAIRGSQRPYSAQAYDDTGNGTLYVGGSGAIPGGRLTGLKGGSHKFGPDGSLTPYNSATDAYNYDADLYNQVPNKRYLFSGSAHYEFSPAATVFAEGQFIDSKSTIEDPPTPTSGLETAIQVDSPFLPASTQAYLKTFDPKNTGYVTAGVSRRYTEITDRLNQYNRKSYRGLLGLKGDVGGGWHYETYYSYAHSSTATLFSGNLQTSHILAATDTVFADPSTLSGAAPVTSPFPIAGLSGGGTLVCASAAARAGGCVPADIYGSNRLSAAAINYLTANYTNRESSSTQVASAVITNDKVFSFANGGPVGVVAGTEWRRESGDYDPAALVAAGDIQGNATGLPTSGHYSVAEAYSELDMPILKGMPLANLLELNGAGRVSHYSTDTGTVFTFSGGGIYKPVADIGFRAQFQRAIRAPNVNELFQGAQDIPSTTGDPCNTAAVGSAVAARCIATGVPAAAIGTGFGNNPEYFSVAGGSTALKAEKSNTFTAGTIFTPSFAPGLVFSADYYNIKINQYIASVGVANTLNLCYAGNTSFCGSITRDPLTGAIVTVSNLSANTGSFKTSGIDFAANYHTSVAHNVSIALASQFTYLLTRTLVPVAALPNVVNACAGKFGVTCGQPFPNWRGVSRASLTAAGITTSIQWQYIGPSLDDGTAGYPLAVNRLPATSYFDLSFNMPVANRFSFGVGVNNIFNKQPTILGDNDQGDTANTWPALYDVVGRRFFVTFSAKLR